MPGNEKNQQSCLSAIETTLPTHLVLIAIERLFWLFKMINVISFGMNFDSLLTFPSVLVFLKQRLL